MVRQTLRHTGWTLALVLLSGWAAVILSTSPHSIRRSSLTNPGNSVRPKVSLPIYFEINEGQASEEVLFLANGNRAALYLLNQQAVFELRGTPDSPMRSMVQMRLIGANPVPEIAGEQELTGKSNYLTGSNPHHWRTDIPHYARVRYRNVYPGVDLVFYGNQGMIEYDFVLSPGADPDQVRLQFSGAERPALDAAGNLILHSPAGDLVQRAPDIYQEVSGSRREIAGGYSLERDGSLRFRVESYDARHSLVLDPVIEFSRYFGGNREEEILSVATDADGNIYIGGESSSPDLEVSESSLPYPASVFNTEGNTLAFVAKLDPTGTRLHYLTYLGGSKTSVGHNLKVDSAGSAYVGGRTEAEDFPLRDPIQPRYGGGSDDGFLSKLTPDGSALVYSTYIGGSEYDQVRALALDGDGNAYVTGITESANFPTSNPIQASYAGKQDTFVAKVSADGSALVYSTYAGGSENEVGHAITVDPGGNAYITGLSNSPDFPTTQDAVQPGYAGGEGDDTIVVKINADGSEFLYSTFLGGTKDDESRAVAVDADGNAVITGYTQSDDFPTANALQENFGGASHDIFVAQLNSRGAGLRFSTYLGGTGSDYGRGLALDPSGNIWLTGYTDSTDFPTREPLQGRYSGGAADVVIVKLSPLADQLLYSTFLGGTAYERGRGITVDTEGNILVSGRTESPDFPVSRQPSQTFGGGSSDAFLVKFAPDELSD